MRNRMKNSMFILGVVLSFIFTQQAAANNFDEIRDTIDEDLSKVNDLVTEIGTLPQTIDDEIEKVKTKVETDVKSAFDSVATDESRNTIEFREIFDQIRDTVDEEVSKVNDLVTKIGTLPQTIDDEIKKVKDKVVTDVKNAFESVATDVSRKTIEVKEKIIEIPGKVTTALDTLENKITGFVSDLKTSVVESKEDMENFFSNEKQKIASGVEKLWNDATTVDAELLACLEQLSKSIKEGLDELGDFGDLVQKGITNFLSPHKCLLCASVLSDESLKSCGCSTNDRRLSDSLWYAAEKYGPDKNFYMKENKGQTSSTRRELASSPVTNDLGQCPSAPLQSHSPGYSDTKDKFYSDFLFLHQKSIYPHIRFDQIGSGETCSNLNITMDPIVSPNKDNNDKWDSRTNQNIVAALQAVESIIGNVFALAEAECEWMPQSLCYVGCVTNPVRPLCWLVVAFGYRIMAFFEYLSTAIDLHDDVVDGAEIQSTLINTEHLINWTCNIEKTMNKKFQELELSITDNRKTEVIGEIKNRFVAQKAITVQDDLNNTISEIDNIGEEKLGTIKASLDSLNELMKAEGIFYDYSTGDDACTESTCPPPP